MATYLELYTVANENAALLAKLTTACAIAANSILQETSGPNLAARRGWATGARDNPRAAAQEIIWPCLAQLQASTPTITPAQINQATDASIQTAVDTQVSRRFGPSS